MEIFICDEIESCDEQWLAAALERLPAERRQRALRYRQTADRIRSAAAYLLLAYALGERELRREKGELRTEKGELRTEKGELRKAPSPLAAETTESSETTTGLQASQASLSSPFSVLPSQFSPLSSHLSPLSSPFSVLSSQPHQGLQSPLPGLSYGEWGKPYLAGRPEVQFSMSHCRGAVAVAVDTTPVGVDIEPLQRFDEAMAAQFCTPEEYRAIITATNRDAMFTEMWTRKESCLKQCGVAPPADLRLIPTSGRKKFHIFHTGRHILAACSDYPHPTASPIPVPLPALMP